MVNNEIYRLRREQMQILCFDNISPNRSEYYQYLEKQIQMLERLERGCQKVVDSKPSKKRSILKRAK